MFWLEYKKFTQRSSSVEFFKKSVALKVRVYVCSCVFVFVYVCVCVCVCVCVLYVQVMPSSRDFRHLVGSPKQDGFL